MLPVFHRGHLSVLLMMLLVSGCLNAGSAPASPAPEATVASHNAATTAAPNAPTTAPTAVANAPVAPQAAENPACAFKPIDVEALGGAPFQNPVEVRSENGVLNVTLDITYTQYTIAGCPVNLRSYNGAPVGPTLRARPGDTLRITLKNSLPENPADGHGAHTDDINTPHNFNTTNLHTHGLHVSPSGNSDNVLLAIEPQTSFEYEIKIPPDHPPGTYWYHPHNHGSVAIQVASGMSGALIIEGGLDELPAIAAAKEQTFVLQQTPYDEAGLLEDYKHFGPCTWENSRRAHTINGQLFPVITMAPGEVQRWRFIHSGIREQIDLELRGPGSDATPTITEALTLPTNDLNEIAVDGIALGRISTWQQVDLAPGYRSDVLVRAPAPGTYYLVDGGGDDKALTCPDLPEQPNFLAKVVVTGAEQSMSLPTAAEVAPLLPFEPLVEINSNEQPGSDGFLKVLNAKGVPDGMQRVSFSIASFPSDIPVGDRVIDLYASDRSFSFDRKRSVKLGNIDVWVLETAQEPDMLYYAHPFHIHVNPFQTWRLGPGGQPELIWRDTLMVPVGQKQYVFTQYRDYIGTFVYHCHILDHEDAGMMELVEIVD